MKKIFYRKCNIFFKLKKKKKKYFLLFGKYM